MSNEDKHLIARLKKDDQQAFDELFHAYHIRVYNLALRFLRSREEAEEIVQTVFIAIWENRSRIDEDRPFSAYILTIARHWIYNALKKAVYRKGFLDYILVNRENEEFLVEETILFNELSALVDKTIDGMPPRRKEIFRLSRDKGLSYKEIAKLLSITESTVNTQISKAIDQLRDCLKIYNH